MSYGCCTVEILMFNGLMLMMMISFTLFKNFYYYSVSQMHRDGLLRLRLLAWLMETLIVWQCKKAFFFYLFSSFFIIFFFFFISFILFIWRWYDIHKRQMWISSTLEHILWKQYNYFHILMEFSCWTFLMSLTVIFITQRKISPQI